MLSLMTLSYCEDNCTVIFSTWFVDNTSIKDSSSMKIECLQVRIKLTVLMKSIILMIWVFISLRFSIDLLMIISWILPSFMTFENVYLLFHLFAMFILFCSLSELRILQPVLDNFQSINHLSRRTSLHWSFSDHSSMSFWMQVSEFLESWL